MRALRRGPGRSGTPISRLAFGAVLFTIGFFLTVAMYSSLPGIFLILAGLFFVRTRSQNPADHNGQRLPSRTRGGQVIGGFMANLEHVVSGQPSAVPQIEEQYSGSWATIGDVTVDGLDEPLNRPDRPDRSGARV